MIEEQQVVSSTAQLDSPQETVAEEASVVKKMMTVRRQVFMRLLSWLSSCLYIAFMPVFLTLAIARVERGEWWHGKDEPEAGLVHVWGTALGPAGGATRGTASGGGGNGVPAQLPR